MTREPCHHSARSTVLLVLTQGADAPTAGEVRVATRVEFTSLKRRMGACCSQLVRITEELAEHTEEDQNVLRQLYLGRMWDALYSITPMADIGEVDDETAELEEPVAVVSATPTLVDPEPVYAKPWRTRIFRCVDEVFVALIDFLAWCQEYVRSLY